MSKSTTMNCQKCRAPLKLDSSLEDLNPAAFDILVNATSPQPARNIPPSRPAYSQDRKHLYDRVSKNASSSNFRRNIVSVSSIDGAPAKSGPYHNNPAMSFVMLTESQVVPPSVIKSPEDTSRTRNTNNRTEQAVSTLDGVKDEGKAKSQDMERHVRLFEILTSRSDIDHPVCTECTSMLIDGLQKRLDSATRERDHYVTYLKQVNASIPTPEEISESQQLLAKAQEDEACAFATLKAMEKEKAVVDEEIAALEEEALALDIEEQRFWADRNAFAMKLQEFQNVRDSINTQYSHDTQLLERLQRTNVYNDTFCISHDGKFGTINGLRLGRLSTVPVEWPEINAAWGHTVLLLSTVAEKLGYKFKSYELLPMGSTSRILKHEPLPSPSSSGHQTNLTRPTKKTILELHSSGDLPLGLTFLHRRFDTAMVAFLECMRQLGAFVEAQSARASPDGRGLALPYPINADLIGGVSIKLGLQRDDDAWSRACKFTLTCCKFLLAHASNVNAAAAVAQVQAQGRR